MSVIDVFTFSSSGIGNFLAYKFVLEFIGGLIIEFGSSILRNFVLSDYSLSFTCYQVNP